MNEINKRLIDANRMIADYQREKAFNESIGNKERAWDILTFIVDLESDKYLVPSNQGEAAILREALDGLMSRLQHDANHNNAYEYTKAAQTLSSHTEESPKFRCMKCGKDVGEDESEFWHAEGRCTEDTGNRIRKMYQSWKNNHSADSMFSQETVLNVIEVMAGIVGITIGINEGGEQE